MHGIESFRDAILTNPALDMRFEINSKVSILKRA
jgi:hypothetical protein